MIYARGTGSVAFVCPHCHSINGPRNIDYRLARTRCHNDHCHHLFRIGFAFDGRLDAVDMPFNGWHGNQKSGLRLQTNRPATPEHLYPLKELHAAAYNGPLEYICPTCQTFHQTRPTSSGVVYCTTCTTTWHVGVILWSMIPGARLRGPIDWNFSPELDAAPQPLATSSR